MARLTEWTKRLPKLMTRKQLQRLEAKERALDAAWAHAPWHFTRAHLLRELDARTLAFVQTLQGASQVWYAGGGRSVEESDRMSLVESVRLWRRYDPLMMRGIALWTDYGFGQQVQITLTDDRSQAIWEEFWDDNQRMLADHRIHDLSTTLLTDGEVFLCYWTSQNTGRTRLRRFPTEEITEIATMPDDKDIPLYYHRYTTETDGQVIDKWYPDCRATGAELEEAVLPDGAVRAEQEDPLTHVQIQHVPFVLIDGRGWPMPRAAWDWAKAYREFIENHAAVAKSRAAVTEVLQHSGGSRATEELMATLQSGWTTGWEETNPPPVAGSTAVMNKGADLTRLDLGTGATDAQIDSMMLIAQVATALQVPPFMLGRTDTMQNKATAEMAMEPTLRAWGRYQTLWRSVFSEMVDIVLGAAENYGTIRTGELDHTAQIVLSSPLDTDFEQVAQAVDDFWDREVLSRRTLSRVAAQLPELGLTPEQAEEELNQLYGEYWRGRQRRGRARRQPNMLDALRDLLGEAQEGNVESLLQATKLVNDA